MPLFFVRLKSSRPDFAQTMTAEEQAVMRRHSEYLKEELAAGRLVVAGPVMDPAGVFGMGVFEAATLDEVKASVARDPAATIGRHEISPMGPSTYRK